MPPHSRMRRITCEVGLACIVGMPAHLSGGRITAKTPSQLQNTRCMRRAGSLTLHTTPSRGTPPAWWLTQACRICGVDCAYIQLLPCGASTNAALAGLYGRLVDYAHWHSQVVIACQRDSAGAECTRQAATTAPNLALSPRPCAMHRVCIQPKACHITVRLLYVCRPSLH